MKRIIITFVAAFATHFAFCQEPTTTTKENLKGNVFSVITSKYNYLENFGNPTEGNLLDLKVTIFDNHGRAILYHFDSERDGYGSAYGLVNYTIDGENTVANISMLSPTRIKELNSISELNNYLEEKYFEKREIVYNNNIVIKHDVLKKNNNPTSKFKLDHRKIAKPLGNGTYECKLYDKSGESFLEFKETYNSNGQLTELDNEREFNRVYTPDYEIMIPHAGKYQYNNKGQLILYTQQKNSAPISNEYVYNDQGDLTQDNTLSFHQGRNKYVKNRGLIYDNYKYDDKGNWIYRMVSNGKKYLYIEKRQIEYCNTTEEIESKVKELYSKFPVTDIKAIEDFSDFYEKYLKDKRYTCQIPLIEYDSKYASVKNADKAVVDVNIDFSNPSCEGRQNIRLTMPDKYYSKFINVAEEIQVGVIKCKYVYRDGKMIMNNEEYVIDTSTGELKNITRNITLKKE